MESQLGPTIALLVTAVLFFGGIVLIILGLRSPEPVLGAPARPQAPDEPLRPEQLIFTGLAAFLAVVVLGLSLGITIPGRGSPQAEVPLTKIEPKPTVDESKLAGAELGKQVFARAACNTCHGIKEGEKIVGPSMHGIWKIAATRKPGVSAKDYLHESIVKPGAFVPEGYPDGVMPQNFGQTLKAEEIDALLAYFETEFNK
jgi:mono/diheme cytochrome c family protein